MTRATTLPPRGRSCAKSTSKQAKQEFPKTFLELKGRAKAPESCLYLRQPWETRQRPALLSLKSCASPLCRHSYCFSHRPAEENKSANTCYNMGHIYLDLSGTVLLHLQTQPQSYQQKGERGDSAITRILHPLSSSSAKSSPSGSAAPICKSWGQNHEVTNQMRPQI